jgi:outer membrane protein OmpA-like peptidoglycan-associated protein/tetratricopeptide (TPR) repeat protein
MQLKAFISNIIILIIALSAMGQSSLKKAQKHVEAGNELLVGQTYPQYEKALEEFKKAHDIIPSNPDVNFKIGACYINTVDKTKAIDYLEEAIDRDASYNDVMYYLLGRAYHLDLQFDKAIEFYNKYKDRLKERELKRGKRVPRYIANNFREKRRFTKDEYIKISGMLGIIHTRIEECKTGKKLVENPKNVEISNLGKPVNSPHADYGPVISADEAVMYFTGRKPNTTGGERDNVDGQFYEDVYVTHKENDSTWTTPDNDLGGNINTESHESAMGLSADGQTLFLFGNPGDGGEIYISELRGDEWSESERIEKPVNSDYGETSVSLGPGGQVIYFVSDRPGSYGGSRDIYKSEKKSNGEWGEAKNLESPINTNFDEEGVFIHPDGKTLYFSSKGHESMGGYDVFKSVNTDTGWSTPENMGYPINTPDDDVFFVMSGSGEQGYFSTVRPDGVGEKDIYTIDWTPDSAEGIDKREAKRLTIVKGIVTDKADDEPLGADIKVVDNEKDEIVAELSSNSKTGQYLISLPAGKNYGIQISKDDYLFKSKNFNIPDTQAYEEIVLDIELEKAQKGAKITLENIFFDYDDASLRDESKPELDRLAEFMQKNSDIKVEISGHTDSKGDNSYNQKLSQQRAQSAVDYLVKEHNIDKERLKAVGYGETRPIAPNILASGEDNSNGRQLNRRIELEILDEEGKKESTPSKRQTQPITLKEAMSNHDGIVFSVQIATTQQTPPQAFLNGFEQVIKYQTDGNNKYLSGIFKNFEEAKEHKREISRKGLESAFIVAFENGERIDVQKAIAKTQ